MGFLFHAKEKIKKIKVAHETKIKGMPNLFKV